MEKMIVLLIPVLLAANLIRLLMLPMKFVMKLSLHCTAGFLCL